MNRQWQTTLRYGSNGFPPSGPSEELKGTLYDPMLGRMLSPDPVVQSPGNLQNYNRYNYCLNNPLKYTDPTGYQVYRPAFDAFGYPTQDSRNNSDYVGSGGGGGGHVSYWSRPGVGGNGTGEGGYYYDYSSGAYRSTTDGSDVGYGWVHNTYIERYAEERWWRQDAYAGSGSEMVYKGSIWRHSASATRIAHIASSQGGGDGWAVTAAAGYMVALQTDLVTPDPSDAAWPKWVGHAVLGTTSAIILYSAGKSILNPNLEGTTTSRGNPTDWSFDPEINRLQNDKYYPPGSRPPGWFWPAIGAAGAYELYQNWPKPNIPQLTQPVNNTYVVPARPIYPYGN